MEQCQKSLAHTEIRLDRAICNDEWLSYWSSSVCYTLVKSKSDQYPIMLSMQKDNASYNSSFKFMRMWASHPDCYNIVSQAWENQVIVVPCSFYRNS